MTRTDFYEKYGDIQVMFSSYCKYTFTYAANLPDGKRLSVLFGGDAEAIYRHEAANNSVTTVSQLQPYAGYVYDGDKEIDGFYDC